MTTMKINPQSAQGRLSFPPRRDDHYLVTVASSKGGFGFYASVQVDARGWLSQ
jgi:hypothetical protein